jgi:hypothetical protein
MKNLLRLFVLLTCSAFLSCNESHSNEIPKLTTKSSDTIKTVLAYPQNGQLIINVGFRIIRDTTVLTTKDSVTFTKTWTKDTTYFIPITDTVRDKQMKPKLDSITHKPTLTTYYYPVLKKTILLDGNKDIPTILKENNLK